MTQVAFTPVTDPTEMFCHYPGQTSPQKGYIALDSESGHLTVGYEPGIGSGMSMREFHRIILSWSLPPLTMAAANRLLKSAAPIAQRILDGSSVEWNGNNHVGVQNTPDARQAINDLEDLCQDYRDDVDEILFSGDVSDWYVDGDDRAVAWHDLTAATTDAQLDAIGQEVEAEALECHVVLPAHEVVEYLAGLRDGLREE